MDHIKDFIELQKEIPSISFNETVSFGKVAFKYADLPSIHKVVKPLIHKHNFLLTYPPEDGYITCVLMHISGKAFEGRIAFIPSSDDKQTGAKITYFKRYLISALLAIDTEDDKDAKPFEEKPKKAKLTDKAFDQACERIINHETGVLNKVLAYFEITQDQHDSLLNLDLTHNG